MADSPDPTVATQAPPTQAPPGTSIPTGGPLTVPDKPATAPDGNPKANARGRIGSTISPGGAKPNWGKWALRLLGKVGRKAFRYADLFIPDNGATLDDRVPQDDFERSVQQEGEDRIKNGEDSWDVQKWYHKTIDDHRAQNVRVNKCPSRQVDSITMKRKHIRPFSNDGNTKYGHWWTQIGPDESYGWYPQNDDDLGAKGTLCGVPGVLNDRTGRGSDTQDPHHNDTDPDEQFHPQTEDGDCRTDDEIKECLRNYFQGFSGEWSWPRGPNCQTVQTSAMEHCGLSKPGAGS